MKRVISLILEIIWLLILVFLHISRYDPYVSSPFARDINVINISSDVVILCLLIYKIILNVLYISKKKVTGKRVLLVISLIYAICSLETIYQFSMFAWYIEKLLFAQAIVFVSPVIIWLLQSRSAPSNVNS